MNGLNPGGMKLAYMCGTAQRDWDSWRTFAIEAERIGVDSLWCAEFTGHDAFTPLAFVAGHTEKIGLGTGVATLGGRTPTNLAMTAVSLAAMSGGRFMLGLGANVREGVEGWHGQPFAPPSRNLAETAAIVRMAAAGQDARFRGDVYRIPLSGEVSGAMEPGLAQQFPLYFATTAEASLRVTGAVADGWVGGASFGPEVAETFWSPIRQGAAAAGRELAGFDFMAPAFMFPTQEVGLAMGRPFLATLLANQGAWANSRHSAVYERSGYGDLIGRLRSLFAEGKDAEAANAVPEALVLGRCLAGTDEEVRATLRSYRSAGVTTIQVQAGAIGMRRITVALDDLARLRALIDDVNAEAVGAA